MNTGHQGSTNKIHVERLGRAALFAATILALIICNSKFKGFYDHFIDFPIGISNQFITFYRPVEFWVNDVLFCFFFMLIGMEIKREFLIGELSEKSKLLLPVITACFGVIVPAIIYALFNLHYPRLLNGWAIPTPTDVAFSLAVLGLVGKRIPPSIRIFLISLAIIDDLIAVIIIALFYAKHLSLTWLLSIAVLMALLLSINKLKLQSKLPYIILGTLLLYSVVQSGIHTSIFGVLLAFSLPTEKQNGKRSMLEEFEALISNWVILLVIPLFAFVNAGVAIGNLSLSEMLSTLSLGVICGLFFGKQIGIFGSAWILIKLKKCTLPTRATWMQMYGVSVLCGIGFTMSLFINILAFESRYAVYDEIVKAAILVGSSLSAILGCLVLHFCKSKDNQKNII